MITALVLGIVIDRCLPGSKFHYLSLFALGMCGALINFSPPGSKFHALENKVSWGWITIALITVFLGLSRHGVEWLEAHSTPGDLLIGLATVSFIVYCTAGQSRLVDTAREGVILRILGSTPATTVGAFSYSL